MRKLVLVILLTMASVSVWGQKADLRKGNREFRKGEYGEADISYRKGLLKDTSSVAAKYNLANNLYRQENYDEAAKMLDGIENPDAAACFNRGDVAIAKEDWKTAVDSFKECLLQDPGDLKAKENYIYARNKLMEQQQQEQQQNQDQNKDNQDQNKDQDQNQDQQQQDQQQDQDKKDKKDQQQQQQQQQQELSAQQAQQLLQAIQEKEKQTQEKVDEKKAAALKSRQKEKNW
jgi:FtsZ-interacting cell division protein ZipA